MMIGVQMKREGNALVDQARGKGVLINVASDTVIRLVPPFVITKDEINRAVDVVSQLSL
jgi:acetylornithine/N-succinyldiaminopimelate aminotransferase